MISRCRNDSRRLDTPPARMGHPGQFETRKTFNDRDESKNYLIAAGWLKRAKQAYKLLGKTDDWESYLAKNKGIMVWQTLDYFPVEPNGG